MSGFAATIRSAACCRTSAQERTARGTGNGDLPWTIAGEGATVSSGGGLGAVRTGGTRSRSSPGAWSDELEQPTMARAARQTAASTLRRTMESVKGTIYLLGEFLRYAFDGGKVLDAGVAHAARPAEALHEFGPFLRPDAVDLFEPARPGANTGTTRPHSGDGETMRLVADLRHQHQRSRLATQPDLGPPVGKD